MIISTAPTFDNLRDEQRCFIGPPAPPQIPKFTPVRERGAVYAMMLDDLVARIAAETSAYDKQK